MMWFVKNETLETLELYTNTDFPFYYVDNRKCKIFIVIELIYMSMYDFIFISFRLQITF